MAHAILLRGKYTIRGLMACIGRCRHWHAIPALGREKGRKGTFSGRRTLQALERLLNAARFSPVARLSVSDHPIWRVEAARHLMALLPIQRTDLPPRTIPLFKLESVALGWPDRAIARVQPMSALGHKQTFCGSLPNVCFAG